MGGREQAGREGGKEGINYRKGGGEKETEKGGAGEGKRERETDEWGK